jgi:SPX domain protein involved in polyphosphate accumulation
MNKVFSEINQSSENKRYEIKLVYDGLRMDEVASWIRTHPFLFRREYPTRQVNNIYFDTIEMNLRYEHIQGVNSRYKLRYRWYYNTWLTNKGILEVKHKSGKLGKKESFPIENELDLTNLSWYQIQERIRSELTPEWKSLLDSTRPVLINSYVRDYYIDAEREIRITLDTRQKAYLQVFKLKPNLTLKTPICNTLVLEVKAGKIHHRKIADVMAAFPHYGSAHSKYLEGTENLFW